MGVVVWLCGRKLNLKLSEGDVSHTAALLSADAHGRARFRETQTCQKTYELDMNFTQTTTAVKTIFVSLGVRLPKVRNIHAKRLFYVIFSGFVYLSEIGQTPLGLLDVSTRPSSHL